MSCSRRPATTWISSSVSLPHFSRTSPLTCFHLPSSWSEFMSWLLCSGETRLHFFNVNLQDWLGKRSAKWGGMNEVPLGLGLGLKAERRAYPKHLKVGRVDLWRT